MKNSNKKGFTLVELVVVIAIIGVLAAILVPSLMGYVKKSRLKTANSNAKTAYEAVAEWVADEETAGRPGAMATAAGNAVCNTNTAPTTPGWAPKVYAALRDNGNEAGEVYAGIAAGGINGNADAFFCHWRKTATDDLVGQYPEAVKDVDNLVTWSSWTHQT